MKIEQRSCSALISIVVFLETGLRIQVDFIGFIAACGALSKPLMEFDKLRFESNSITSRRSLLLLFTSGEDIHMEK